ncbi:MAG: SPFH domain-containing protein [Polyangiaceae bacterium]
MRIWLVLAASMGASLCTGCYGETIEPGHRGLFFDPRNGGLQHEVLAPGYHKVGMHGRIDDFDVTYSTNKEEVRTTSQEGLALDLKVAIRYRPVVAELYELDTEVGPNYYEEVVGPEFRSAARGVFARHSYLDLQKNNEKLEDEVEAELRRRTQGKHVEISSITLEAVEYAPEIINAVRAKLVGEQEAIKQKAALENESLRRKLELERGAEQEKLKAEAAVRQKESERSIAEQQALIDKVKAEAEATTRVTKARGEAEEVKLMAKAHAEERKATAIGLTPLAVQMHAYDALGQLGGNGTTIYLGDWSRAPNFLFPPLMGAYGGGGAVRSSSFTPTTSKKDDSPYK